MPKKRANAATTEPHSFHDRMKQAFQLRRKPTWFDDFIGKLVTVVEPRATPFYRELRAGGATVPETLAANILLFNRLDVWGAPSPERERRRERLLDLARIGDGATFTTAKQILREWRERKKLKAAATAE